VNRSFFSKLFRLHEFQEHDIFQRAEVLRIAILGSLGLISVFGLLFFLQTTIPWVTLITVLVIDLGLFLALKSIEKGHVNQAGALYALILWSSITYVVAFVHCNYSSPVASFYILITVLFALLMGRIFSLIIGGLSLATITVIMLVKNAGMLPEPMVNLTTALVAFWYMMIFMASILLVDLIARAVKKAFREVEAREQELTLKNRELEEIRQSLEERVIERTHEILREKRFFEALFLNSPVAIVSMDLLGRVTAANPAFESLFGYTEEEVLGKVLDDLVADPAYPDDPYDNTKRTLRGELILRQGRRRRKDGGLMWMDVRGMPVVAGDEKVGMLAIYYDLTETKKAQEELAASEQNYRSLFENVMDGVYRTSVDGRFLEANPALVRMLGFETMDELWSVDIRNDIYFNPEDRDRLVERWNHESVTRNLEIKLKRKNGDVLYVLENSFVVRDTQGKVAFYEGTLTDITELKLAEERLQFMATHDSLTGLATRKIFFDQLNALIQKGPPNRHIAVVFIDLDGFKEINDLYGHARGDLLLQRVSHQMRSALRPGDLIARLGGDEFAVYFDQISGANEAARLAAIIQSSLNDPLGLDIPEHVVTSSIGISLYPEDGHDAENLLKRADTAMYRVKKAGKNNIRLFSK